MGTSVVIGNPLGQSRPIFADRTYLHPLSHDVGMLPIHISARSPSPFFREFDVAFQHALGRCRRDDDNGIEIIPDFRSVKHGVEFGERLLVCQILLSSRDRSKRKYRRMITLVSLRRDKSDTACCAWLSFRQQTHASINKNIFRRNSIGPVSIKFLKNSNPSLPLSFSSALFSFL